MSGASGSVWTATMWRAPWQPAMCWMAPLIPQARDSSGAILVPVWPTCWRGGRPPWLVPTRETATSARAGAAEHAADRADHVSQAGEALGTPEAAPAADDHPARREGRAACGLG